MDEEVDDRGVGGGFDDGLGEKEGEGGEERRGEFFGGRRRGRGRNGRLNVRKRSPGGKE